MRLPGFVNAHTHVYSALAPLGMPALRVEPRSFAEILSQVWWRLDRALDPRSLRAAARLYAAEALLQGTTTLIDHHESPAFIEGSLEVIADACQELGIRALLCYGATERNGGRDEGRRGLAECARFIASNRRPHVRGMIGLHASFTVSAATLEQAAALCAELATPCHVHVAEDRLDLEDARRRGAPGPLERLLAAAALPAGSIVAHGVHLTRVQVREAAARGVWIVQNPRSNQHNRVGYPGALDGNPRVALGTDGFPSDLREEARALARLAAAHEPETPRDQIEQRLAAGNRLAAERFGTIEMREDVVELAPASDPGDRSSAPAARPTAATLEAPPATGRVMRVVVGGRTVVEDGSLVTGDLEEIRAEARSEAARLWPRMEALP